MGSVGFCNPRRFVANGFPGPFGVLTSILTFVFAVRLLSIVSGRSKNAASSAVGRTAGNVVFAHTHQSDESTLVLPGVGLVKAWNPGCMCQRQPLWRHSNPTNWSHGYAVQFVAKSGDFMHINVAIWEGKSLAREMVSRMRG